MAEETKHPADEAFARTNPCPEHRGGTFEQDQQDAWHARLWSFRDGWDAHAEDQSGAVPLHVTKALALVERALGNEASARAVREQTGGTAPELVQGILDRIFQLRDDLEPAIAPGTRVRMEPGPAVVDESPGAIRRLVQSRTVEIVAAILDQAGIRKAESREAIQDALQGMLAQLDVVIVPRMQPRHTWEEIAAALRPMAFRGELLAEIRRRLEP